MIKVLSYIVYGLVKLISYLPFSVLYVFSDIVFFFVNYILRYRRKVITINLKNSFPEKSDEEIHKIRREFYSHFCDTFIETIKMWSISEEEMKKRCKFLNPEVFDVYKEQNKNVITILGHYGNWEWLSSFALWRDANYLPVYKPLHNKVFDNMFLKIRKRFGAIPVAKDDTLRTMIRYRNEEKLSATVLIGDQTPKKNSISYWTKFLNQDTAILIGTERIAKKLDQAIIFIKMNKIKRGYYEVDLIPLFDNPKETEEFEISEKHTRVLENIIKENPAYWLWSHKRWKHKKETAE